MTNPHSTTGERKALIALLKAHIVVDGHGLGYIVKGLGTAADAILASRMAASSEGEVVEALAKFFRDVNRPFWEGAMEIDGQDVQDIGLRHGLLVKTQFDPGIHTDATGIGIEAGDEWFDTSPAVKAMLAARPDTGVDAATVEQPSIVQVAVHISDEQIAEARRYLKFGHAESDTNIEMAIQAALSVPDKGVQGDQEAKAREFIENWFSPWGSWKTAWWEMVVSDDVEMSDANALRALQKILAQASEGGA